MFILNWSIDGTYRDGTILSDPNLVYLNTSNWFEVLPFDSAITIACRLASIQIFCESNPALKLW